MQVAIELMWTGVPVTAWAIMLPRRSKTPAERAPDSRTTVVNEVRIRAAACSLTTAISRFQRTSRVIGSMVVRVVISLLHYCASGDRHSGYAGGWTREAGG